MIFLSIEDEYNFRLSCEYLTEVTANKCSFKTFKSYNFSKSKILISLFLEQAAKV